jgi:excinuclease UvrABC helicase subunit UvrB
MISVQVILNAQTGIFARKASVIVTEMGYARTSQGSVLMFGSLYADVMKTPIRMNARLIDLG